MRGRRLELLVLAALLAGTAGLSVATFLFCDHRDSLALANSVLFLVSSAILIVLGGFHVLSGYDRTKHRDVLYLVLLVLKWLECTMGLAVVLLARFDSRGPVVRAAAAAWNLSDGIFFAAFTHYIATFLDRSNPIRRNLCIASLVVLLADIALVIYSFFSGSVYQVSPEGVVIYLERALPLFLVVDAGIVGCTLVAFFSVRGIQLKLALTSYYILPLLVEIGYYTLVQGLGSSTGGLVALPPFSGLLGLILMFGVAYSDRGRELELRAAALLHKEHQLLAAEEGLALKERQLAEAEKELEQSQSEARFLQASPHFLYNTLGTVAYVCEEEPERAADLIDEVARYLREGTRLSGRDLVTFREEADLLKAYAAIEKERFPELSLRFDFQATDFLLPSLSVQPLVENAIKHGIRGGGSGAGTVTVVSFEEPGCYVVQVTDDGAGFAGVPDDNNRHIGIASVRHRVENMCGGTFSIAGRPGQGTVACIRIPKVGRGAGVEADGGSAAGAAGAVAGASGGSAAGAGAAAGASGGAARATAGQEEKGGAR